MQTNELRIGNWVLYNDLYCKIAGIDKDQVLIEYHNGETDYCHIAYIDPIEFTEELLFEIGFVQRNDYYILSNENMYLIYYKDSFKQELVSVVKRKRKYYCYKNELKHYDIKYLHQLQNVYYLLTGEELEVEL